jgi:GMP synthase-like glutamine amidotransferase
MIAHSDLPPPGRPPAARPARRIAVLDTFEGDLPFLARHPDDGAKVAAGLRAWRPDWQFETWHVSDGHFPPDPASCDGIVITGSPASVNDERGWIARLLGLIRDLHARGVPLVGICFGHQAIAAALGGRVARAPAGLRLGTVTTRVEHHAPWMTPAQPTLTLYSAHEDQVVELPHGAQVLGRDPQCPVGLYAIGQSVFGLQFHPEFGRSFMDDLIDALAPKLGTAAAARARALVQQPVDATLAMRWIAQFFEQAPPRRSA